jgi:hypothetical protein
MVAFRVFVGPGSARRLTFVLDLRHEAVINKNTNVTDAGIVITVINITALWSKPSEKLETTSG